MFSSSARRAIVCQRAASHFPRIRLLPCPSVAARRSRTTQRRSLSVMAFLSGKQEQLAGLARQYVMAWGSQDGKGVGELLAPDCTFHGDGVLYKHDVTGKDAILKACTSSHASHQHLVYAPFAVAANEADNTAFVGVAWQFKAVPSNDQSEPAKGVSLKKLEFDSNSKITSSRVCRQLTPDEALALLQPRVSYHPVDAYQVVLPLLPEAVAQATGKAQDDKAAAEAMKTSLMTWVGAWSSNGSDTSALNQALSPDLKLYDCYGLHGASQGGVEGQTQKDREGAVNMVSQAAHNKDWVNRNELVSWAVDPGQRVAFDHWRGHVHSAGEPEAGEKFTVEGMDLLMFNDKFQISSILKFDMQDYSKQLKAEAPAGA